jgi:hypothetical protein
MRKLASKKVMAAAAAGLAVAGGGAAIAASQNDSPANSFLDSVAEHLGISSEELRDATKAAAVDQVDRTLEDGLITEEQAEELKARIESDDFPDFFLPGLLGLHGDLVPGSPGPDHHFFFDGKLSAAAEYLGLSEEQLRRQLFDGKSLAEIAGTQDRSVDGLEHAILDGARSALDEAVAADRLTQEAADTIYRRLQASIDEIVNGTFPLALGGIHPRLGPGFGFRFDGPPALVPRRGGDDDGGSGGSSSGDGRYWDTAA